MSLFEAPERSLLVHACNGQGVWGSGIAKEFKNRFSLAHRLYREFCEENDDSTGKSKICSDNGYWIGNLITSKGYGTMLETEDSILVNTTLAINDLLTKLNKNELSNLSLNTEIYSNKFNSGLFRVPWEKTEKILNVFVDKYNINWIICDPNLNEK